MQTYKYMSSTGMSTGFKSWSRIEFETKYTFDGGDEIIFQNNDYQLILWNDIAIFYRGNFNYLPEEVKPFVENYFILTEIK